MVDQVLLYISAAPDLELERDLLSRTATEIPVTLGWRIVHTPLRGEPPDLVAVTQADVHLFILGVDIQAPIGHEWFAAREAGKFPKMFLKGDTVRTPAAQAYVREMSAHVTWINFKDISDLHHQVLGLLADHLIDNAIYFQLRPAEYEQLENWRQELSSGGVKHVEGTRGGAGASSVVLSTERYVPSEGVLIK